MEREKRGPYKWVHAKNLYRDWRTVGMALRVCYIAAVVLFLFTLVLFSIADGFTLQTIVLPAKIAGGIFALFAVLMMPSVYLIAWAKGGVDEWEYEAEPWRVKGRKIVHHPGRMKVLRFFAGLGILMSTKPGQSQAMRRLLTDSEKKEFDILLFNDAEVTGDEKTGTIELDSHGQSEEIHVSSADYAQVLELITFKPARRRKTANKTAEIKWTHARSLYRDWGGFMTFLKMLSLSIAGIIAFAMVLYGFKAGFSLDLLASLGKFLGVILLVIWVITVSAYCFWAWANGGVDEWEFEMDDFGIEGRKVVRKAWRMKVLRGIAWILLPIPALISRKTAKGSLFVDIPFSSVEGVSCNEKKELIFLYMMGCPKDIHVPREDYAEVRDFIEQRLGKKPKRRKTGGRKKASATDLKEEAANLKEETAK